MENKRKALIVDNEKLIVKFIKKILEKEKYKVQEAYSGIEAIEKIKNDPPDIIFLDLIMPKMGGDEVCRILKKNKKYQDIPVVIISGVAIEENPNIIDVGANAYIAKGPYDTLKRNILYVLKKLEKDKNFVYPSYTVLGSETLIPRTIVKELLITKHHLEAILNDISEGIVEIDQDEKIIYVNPTAKRIIGISSNNYPGAIFSTLFSRENKIIVHKVFQELIKDNKSIRKQISLVEKEKSFLLTFNKIKHLDMAETVIAIIVDQTEEKRMMKEEIEKEKLSALMEMAATAAHEFSQPMTALIGAVDMLLMRANKENLEYKYIQIISNQVERMGKIIEQIRSIVRYKTKEYDGGIKIVDIKNSSRVKII
ncbi:MAG: response regulator [Deltaproteobacteria bacterium]|nr:response regulator [Deltaproteobacteria bacterium]